MESPSIIGAVTPLISLLSVLRTTSVGGRLGLFKLRSTEADKTILFNETEAVIGKLIAGLSISPVVYLAI